MDTVSTLNAQHPPADEETLARQVAAIIGPASAAAMALAELQRRRDAGETVRIFSHRKSWLVGPASSGAPR